MKALILKDFYVLWKQMRLFVVVLLVFALTQGAFGSVFIVLWCAMLPYTAMAYDERCKWNQLAAMMPYTRRDMVLSKYVVGWLCAGAASLLSLAVQLVMKRGDLPIVLVSLCASACILSITLPLMFRFGVERGRMGMFLLIFLVCIGGGVASSAMGSDGVGDFRLPPMVLLAVPMAAVVLTAISIPLSLRLYAAQE